MLLLGTYEHQIDEKNRIRIPSKFKDALGPNPVIMKGTDKCLFVYTEERAQEVLQAKFQKEIAGDFSDDSKMQLLRQLTSGMQQTEEDKQGRISIKGTLVEFAEISKDIVTIGMFDRLEIWSAENWAKYNSNDIDFDKNLKKA